MVRFLYHQLYWNLCKVWHDCRITPHSRGGNMWRVRALSELQNRLLSVELNQVNLFLTLDCTSSEGRASALLRPISLASGSWLTDSEAGLWLAAETSWSVSTSPTLVRWHACKINVINLSSQSAAAALMGVLQQNKMLLCVFRKNWWISPARTRFWLIADEI